MTCAMLLASALSADAPAQPAPSADRLFRYLGFTAAEQEGLRRGEIVSHAVKELSDKELAITMAMLVPASLPQLLDFARSGKEIEINRDILSHGTLSAGAAGDVDTVAFRDAVFAPSESDEVRDLFEVEPGPRFNLSQPETQRFADLRKRFPMKGCEKDPACTDAVVSSLRDLLKDRLRAYRERGLSGIEPYLREGGKRSDPAAELRNATNAAQFLAREYPQ